MSQMQLHMHYKIPCCDQEDSWFQERSFQLLTLNYNKTGILAYHNVQCLLVGGLSWIAIAANSRRGLIRYYCHCCRCRATAH